MRFARWFTRARAGAARRRWGWLALPLLALPIAWPFFTAGLLQGLDIPNHLMRLVAFDQQIRAGNLYPRWMPDLVLGYGYPLFNYYAPGTYYLAELFRLAGLAYAPALSASLLGLVLVAGWGMWRLAPLKVLSPPHRAPRQAAQARFEDLGQLLGYDLDLPAGGLRAGRSFSVTLYYAATAPATTDYTRFLHLYAAGPGLVAQSDSSPQNGLNPTSAWLPGEVVADTASLTLPASTAPGRYALQLGFYDPASGDRLNVYDRAGQLLPDGQTVLTELEIQP